MGTLDLSKVAIAMGKILKMLDDLEVKCINIETTEEYKEELYGVAYICRVGILDRIDNNSYMHNPMLPIKIPTNAFNSRSETMSSALDITIGKLVELAANSDEVIDSVGSILKKEKVFYQFQSILPKGFADQF